MQVRNLRSCIKVAVDFVSPDALLPCKDMAERLRSICIQNMERGRDGCAKEPFNRPHHDRLQVGTGCNCNFLQRCCAPGHHRLAPCFWQAELIMITSAVKQYMVLHPEIYAGRRT